MKRIFGLLIAAFMTFTLGASAATAGNAYPPSAPTLETPTPTVASGSPVSLTARGFVAGTIVTFQYTTPPLPIAANRVNAVSTAVFGTAVTDANGVASLTVAAPSTPGVYSVTASSTDGSVASLSLSVTGSTATATVARVLPTSGSDSNGMALTAAVLVLVGAGLVGATAVRRRTRSIAA